VDPAVPPAAVPPVDSAEAPPLAVVSLAELGVPEEQAKAKSRVPPQVVK
jgi:hypothetical protein